MKKKQKVTKPSGEIKLTADDYDQIAVRIRDRMSDTFHAIQASQGKLQGAIDQQLGELKTLTEKTAIINHVLRNKIPLINHVLRNNEETFE